MAIVYVLQCLPSGLPYVGVTVKPLKVRWSQHVRLALKGSETALARAIRKYGPDAFLVETLDTFASRGEALRGESEWIARLNSRVPTGYNLTSGGEYPSHHPSSVEKIASKHRGAKRSREVCDRLSLAHGGRPDLREEAVTLVLQGQRITDVAKVLGVNRYTVGRWISSADLTPEEVQRVADGKGVKGDLEAQQRAISLLLQGATFQAASEVLGVPVPTISDWARKARASCPDTARRLNDVRDANRRMSGTARELNRKAAGPQTP